MISKMKINEEEDEKIIFPFLAYFEDKFYIVVILVHEVEDIWYKGQVVYSTKPTCPNGAYETSWIKHGFKKFKGSITLTQ